MSEPIKNRYEFVVLFDVENGNPNGDPDAGNMPRVDPETGYGLVTDVCLKRKIRNYVESAKEGESGYRIYIKDGIPLNTSDKEACAYVGVDPDKLKDAKKKDEHLDEKLRDFMCSNFYDIRTFGAVMTTFVKGALNCGQVRGPVQLGFARSVDPILPQEVTITRVAITTEADAEKKGTEMGRKYIVPYGLYRVEGFLQLSGLQHFKFCRRQWALIYIESQWAENFRTTDGAILHENAHNGGFTESRGDLLVTRDMRIFSRTLGVSGACDVLEFRRGKTGTLQGVRGLKWMHCQ